MMISELDWRSSCYGRLRGRVFVLVSTTSDGIGQHPDHRTNRSTEELQNNRNPSREGNRLTCCFHQTQVQRRILAALLWVEVVPCLGCIKMVSTRSVDQ